MTSGLSSLRVLVVDDNPHMRSIVTAVLKGIGARKVHECADGAEALDALRQWSADVAIVDYHMSPIDGIELTRLVRNAADSPNPYLPIIMLTGYAERSLVMEARDAGVNEFIAKPLSARALVDRLSAVIYKPRPFVRTATYFGPDRRRRQDPSYEGPWRRWDDEDDAGPDSETGRERVGA